jgi:hypothetical protein
MDGNAFSSQAVSFLAAIPQEQLRRLSVRFRKSFRPEKSMCGVGVINSTK